LREITEIRQRPKWADMDAIREIYVNRPNDCHVDHIIPLRGKKVSGLHVPENLQYLPALLKMTFDWASPINLMAGEVATTDFYSH
jgi:hypothetical protein